MQVRLLKKGKLVKAFKIRPDTFTVGSGEDATLRIRGVAELAPRHALIWLDNGQPTLVPSQGCTVLVNGAPVQHAQIGPTDIISLGRFELQIQSLVAPSVPGPAFPPPDPAPDPGPEPLTGGLGTARADFTPTTPAAALATEPKPAPRQQTSESFETSPGPAELEPRRSNQEGQIGSAAPKGPFGPAESYRPQGPRPLGPAKNDGPFGAGGLLPDDLFPHELPPGGSPDDHDEDYGEDMATNPVQSPLAWKHYEGEEKGFAQQDTTARELPSPSDAFPDIEPRTASPGPLWPPAGVQPPSNQSPFAEPTERSQSPFAGPTEPNQSPFAGPTEPNQSPFAEPPSPAEPWAEKELAASPGPQSEPPPQVPAELGDDKTPLEPEPNWRALLHEGDDEEDEEDELNFVEPFSLVDSLVEQMPTGASDNQEKSLAAQVCRHTEGRVWDLVLVRPGKRYRPAPGQPVLLKMKKGRCELFLPTPVQGRVWLGGQENDINARITLKRKVGRLALSEGDSALFEAEGLGHLVQIIHPAKTVRPTLMSALASAGSFVAFVLVLGGLLFGTVMASASIYRPPPASTTVEEETYEEISQEDLALLAAEELDTPEVEEEEEEEQEEQEPEQIREERTKRRPRIARRQSRATSSGGSATSRLLKALQSGGGGGGGGGASLQDVLTNIDAVGSANAASGLFRSTGIFSKMPEGGVKFARRGASGGVQTVGGNALKAGNPGLGRVKGRGGRGGKVRGRVSRVSSQARVQGNIDRADVLRVINERMGAITRCYERRLMSNPSLSGRLVFGWTITSAGRVSGVNVRSSTVADPAVASCISRIIGGMRFPQPRGGSVTISFPFLFRAVDF
jgi:hypothetical protein